MTYTADKPPLPETVEQLKARIPGWGADLDPADRPAVPRERFDPAASGAHWDFPERQPETYPRERSIEHAMLTPVFGTSCPPKGLSGVIRRYSYARFSEGRAAHWLLLIAADRVDSLEGVVSSIASGRPDLPFRETGLRGEVSAHGIASRRGQGRVDNVHQPLDALVVAGPWVLGVGAAVAAVRAVRRRARA
ncbi:hypothetical protein CLV35_0831 [Motilibacter peucedani]|uniref:Uncharacterized protein n=1 Tax=Motilibacter peucedani TaxID=598650 RepID=A0A420XUH2_9ACTN|nr:hypothetical protein [Motilibacter peucedani]RKS80400.1 hypothetical protein CLV35_0831 [Motilibacter peucedani]